MVIHNHNASRNHRSPEIVPVSLRPCSRESWKGEEVGAGVFKSCPPTFVSQLCTACCLLHGRFHLCSGKGVFLSFFFFILSLEKLRWRSLGCLEGEFRSFPSESRRHRALSAAERLQPKLPLTASSREEKWHRVSPTQLPRVSLSSALPREDGTSHRPVLCCCNCAMMFLAFPDAVLSLCSSGVVRTSSYLLFFSYLLASCLLINGF